MNVGILNNEEVGMYVSDSESEDYEPNSRKGSSRRVRRRLQERLEQLDEGVVIENNRVDLDKEMVDYVMSILLQKFFEEVPVVPKRKNKKKKKNRLKIGLTSI